MKAYKCDLCGSYFTDNSTPVKYTLLCCLSTDEPRDYWETMNGHKELDLCFNCQGEVDLARKYQRGIKAGLPPKEDVDEI